MTAGTGPPNVIPTAERPTVRGWWSPHALNNGRIFAMTVRGVRLLPRGVSYAIGHVGTWLAWRLMHATTDAIASNLAPLFPHESRQALRRRALDTYRSYAADTIDFLRALSASPEEARELFDLDAQGGLSLHRVLSDGRGALLVAGHFGNWEIGGILMARVLGLPLTIVAMAEADPEIHRIRGEIRTAMGIKTLEVRQSLDTALQIRRTLAENRFVALLVDRHVGRDRIAVSLLGRPAWFLQTPALLAYLTGTPMVPCFLERIGAGRFATIALEPIYVDRELPRQEAIMRATQQFADALGSRIRLKPHLWYQFYSYWDAQDDGVAQ